ncbi:MAG TPA: hypothetical protein VHE34_09475 [Puia sp.]|uniref:hypothetical protein n=1 Tax=Puia sp. TaxID=2045100 RepID=UPI002B964F32|nr:hypothetical protein [Puia sp.]HVU95444.1 hypothetical protein [Puia sp.]
MLVYLYITSIAIAFIASLPVHRWGVFSYRVISTIMGLDLVVELWANFLWFAFRMNNLPIYNFAMLAEFWLYAFYFDEILVNRTVRPLIKAYLWLLPAVWLILVILHQHDWSSIFFVIGAIFTIFLAAFNYYQLFTADELVRLGASFEFWVATGLILFYGLNFPYLGMLNFLNKHYPDLARAMITGLQVLNIIFYSIFTYAFVCLRRYHIRKSS